MLFWVTLPPQRASWKNPQFVASIKQADRDAEGWDANAAWCVTINNKIQTSGRRGSGEHGG